MRDNLSRVTLSGGPDSFGATIQMHPNAVYYESGWKFVMSVSGGGQEVIGDLTRHGNMSGVLLEALVPYDPPAYKKLIGGKVDRIVSPAAARAAAMACYERAREYAPDHLNVFGFASTGAVVKVGGEREGRKHKVCMCIQDSERTIGVNLVYKVGRERLQEEELTARCIREALKWGCHRFGDVKRQLSDGDELKTEWQIASPSVRNVVLGVTAKHPDEPSKAIFSSSCNPLHDGHLNIIADAYDRLGHPIDIELCVKNADKPPLDYRTIMERLDSVVRATRDNRTVGGIFLTNKPMFFDKAELFPGATFIMGMDTFDRVLDSSYYDNPDVLYWAFAKFHKILVYPRKGYEPRNLDMDVVEHHKDVITFVSPFDGYEVSDISSTAIRSADRA